MTAALWEGEETVVPAALRGYRAWRVRDSALRSTGVSHSWELPEVTAACLAGNRVGGDADCDCDLCMRHDHRPPVRDCSCGIYAWYDPSDSRLVEGDVFGVVEATGRTVMASHGFRAERARIVALAIEPIDPYRSMRMRSFTLSLEPDPPSASELHQIARWAKTHGVRVFPSRAELLEAYPPEDVSSLVQHDCSAECGAHPEHGVQQALRQYQSSHTLALGLSCSYSTSTYLNAPNRYPEPSAPAADEPCKQRLHVAALLVAVLGWLAGLLAQRHGFVTVGVSGAIINGGLAGWWGRHFWTRHSHWRPSRSTNRSRQSAVPGDDEPASSSSQGSSAESPRAEDAVYD